MAKIAGLVALIAIALAAIRSYEAPPRSAQNCAQAVAQETSRLLAEQHSPAEARRISPLEVSSSRAECR